MDAVKTLRVPPELLRAIRHRDRRERLDESTVIRQLIALGAREYALRLYQEGTITLGEAADLADLPVREMLEALWDRGIRGNVTAGQEREALENVLRLARTAPPRPRRRS